MTMPIKPQTNYFKNFMCRFLSLSMILSDLACLGAAHGMEAVENRENIDISAALENHNRLVKKCMGSDLEALNFESLTPLLSETLSDAVALSDIIRQSHYGALYDYPGWDKDNKVYNTGQATVTIHKTKIEQRPFPKFHDTVWSQCTIFTVLMKSERRAMECKILEMLKVSENLVAHALDHTLLKPESFDRLKRFYFELLVDFLIEKTGMYKKFKENAKEIGFDYYSQIEEVLPLYRRVTFSMKVPENIEHPRLLYKFLMKQNFYIFKSYHLKEKNYQNFVVKNKENLIEFLFGEYQYTSPVDIEGKEYGAENFTQKDFFDGAIFLKNRIVKLNAINEKIDGLVKAQKMYEEGLRFRNGEIKEYPKGSVKAWIAAQPYFKPLADLGKPNAQYNYAMSFRIQGKDLLKKGDFEGAAIKYGLANDLLEKASQQGLEAATKSLESLRQESAKIDSLREAKVEAQSKPEAVKEEAVAAKNLEVLEQEQTRVETVRLSEEARLKEIIEEQKRGEEQRIKDIEEEQARYMQMDAAQQRKADEEEERKAAATKAEDDFNNGKRIRDGEEGGYLKGSLEAWLAARPYFKPFASLGNPRAQHNYGRSFYEEGKVVEEKGNFEEAIHKYEEAEDWVQEAAMQEYEFQGTSEAFLERIKKEKEALGVAKKAAEEEAVRKVAEENSTRKVTEVRKVAEERAARQEAAKRKLEEEQKAVAERRKVKLAEARIRQEKEQKAAAERRKVKQVEAKIRQEKEQKAAVERREAKQEAERIRIQNELLQQEAAANKGAKKTKRNRDQLGEQKLNVQSPEQKLHTEVQSQSQQVQAVVQNQQLNIQEKKLQLDAQPQNSMHASQGQRALTPGERQQKKVQRQNQAARKAEATDNSPQMQEEKGQGTPTLPVQIGPRRISGWVLEDVEDNGNCFYDAVVHQMKFIGYDFLKSVPEGTLPRDSLRLRIQGEKFKDKQWADDRVIDELVKKIDHVMLAIVDTRHPENGYIYYYLGSDGTVTTHIPANDTPLPDNKFIIRLAATGDHFLSVVSDGKFDGRLQEGITNKNVSNNSQSLNQAPSFSSLSQGRSEQPIVKRGRKEKPTNPVAKFNSISSTSTLGENHFQNNNTSQGKSQKLPPNALAQTNQKQVQTSQQHPQQKAQTQVAAQSPQPIAQPQNPHPGVQLQNQKSRTQPRQIQTKNQSKSSVHQQQSQLRPQNAQVPLQGQRDPIPAERLQQKTQQSDNLVHRAGAWAQNPQHNQAVIQNSQSFQRIQPQKPPTNNQNRHRTASSTPLNSRSNPNNAQSLLASPSAGTSGTSLNPTPSQTQETLRSWSNVVGGTASSPQTMQNSLQSLPTAAPQATVEQSSLSSPVVVDMSKWSSARKAAFKVGEPYIANRNARRNYAAHYNSDDSDSDDEPIVVPANNVRKPKQARFQNTSQASGQNQQHLQASTQVQRKHNPSQDLAQSLRFNAQARTNTGRQGKPAQKQPTGTFASHQVSRTINQAKQLTPPSQGRILKEGKEKAEASTEEGQEVKISVEQSKKTEKLENLPTPYTLIEKLPPQNKNQQNNDASRSTVQNSLTTALTQTDQGQVKEQSQVSNQHHQKQVPQLNRDVQQPFLGPSLPNGWPVQPYPYSGMAYEQSIYGQPYVLAGQPYSYCNGIVYYDYPPAVPPFEIQYQYNENIAAEEARRAAERLREENKKLKEEIEKMKLRQNTEEKTKILKLPTREGGNKTKVEKRKSA